MFVQKLFKFIALISFKINFNNLYYNRDKIMMSQSASSKKIVFWETIITDIIYDIKICWNIEIRMNFQDPRSIFFIALQK